MRRTLVLVLVFAAACGDHHAGPPPGNDAPPPDGHGVLGLGAPITLDESVAGYEVDSQDGAVAAANGDTFFVAWTESRAGGAAVEAAHFRADGTRVEATPMVIASASACGIHAACAGDGTCAVLTGTNGSTGCTVELVRVRGDGTVVDATPVGIAPSGNNRQIGGHASGFIVSFTDSAANVSVQRFGTSGAPLAPVSVQSTYGTNVGPCDPTGCWLRTGDRTFVHIAGDGTTTNLTTPAELDPTEWMIVANATTTVFVKPTGIQRVSTAGVLLDASVIPIFDGSVSGIFASIDQASFVFALNNGNVQRLGFDGTLMTPHPFFSIANASSLACLPTRCLVLGPVSGGMGLHAAGIRVDGDTIVDATGPLPLTYAANSQRTPLIAEGASGALVAWQDWRIGGDGPRTATLSTQLSASMPTPMLPHLIAAIDGGYIAFDNRSAAMFERLDSTGAVLTTKTFGAVSDLACGPTSCVVVFTQQPGVGHESVELSIGFDGQHSGSGTVLESGQGIAAPVIVRQADHYVIAYPRYGMLWARVLGDDGTLSDKIQIGPDPGGAYRLAALGNRLVVVIAPSPDAQAPGPTTATLLDESFAPIASAELGAAATVIGITTVDPDHVAIALQNPTSGVTIRPFGVDGAGDPIAVAPSSANPQASMAPTGLLAITSYEPSALAYRLQLVRLAK